MTAMEMDALVRRLEVDERHLEAELSRVRADLAWGRLEQMEAGRDLASIRRSLRQFFWRKRDGGTPVTRRAPRGFVEVHQWSSVEIDHDQL